MNLYSVTINHPRGGTRDLTISSDSKDLKAVEKMCTDAGLDVASVTRVAEEPKPTGRIYGKSAEGPRRNKDEMEQDRAIEDLIERKGYELGADTEYVADALQAELEALPDAPKVIE